MVYRTRYRGLKGFTLVEVMVVVVIFTIFFLISEFTYGQFKKNNNLEIAKYSVVEALRHAATNAQQVNGDSKWGVKIISNQVVVFKGQDYASRIVASDQPLGLPSGIAVSGLNEVVFEKVSGITSNVGTTTLTSDGGSETININAKGTITYQ